MKAVMVFDLFGPMAHFRKYYTNTSSLTYGFPPRTVLMGIVAAILGFERDTYYEELNRGRFAVAVKAPTRRLLQTVNYVRTKKEDLNLLRRLQQVPGTQTPLEFLLPAGDARSLCFRVFFSHPDTGLVQEAGDRLREGRTCFPLYLGITECLAGARFVNIYGTGDYQEVPPGTTVELASVLNVAHLDKIDFSGGKTLNLVRERAPYSFGAGRTLRPPIAVVYESSGKPLSAALRVPSYRFSDAATGDEETVAFLE
ncbi:MAG TPA: CRISPR-associated protein Cas5 [Syntrophomonadaceae bacterium]|nr:CRISPR-associated protein Cas5 [Syntrophomonadaceae bacterium]